MRKILVISLVAGALLGAKLGKELWIRTERDLGMEKLKNYLHDMAILTDLVNHTDDLPDPSFLLYDDDLYDELSFMDGDPQSDFTWVWDQLDQDRDFG
jgi:hypothetical protein